MRPTKSPDSVISAPLNRIFRTEANVRVLRVLSLTRHPLASSEVAARARLDPSGVRRALKELAVQGIVEMVGAGAVQLVHLRMAHPFGDAIQALFRAEASRAASIVREIRRAARSITPLPTAVWMIHPLSTQGEMEALHVGLLAPAKEVDAAVDALRGELRAMELREDLTLEVRGYTAADLAVLSDAEEASLQAAVPVVGLPPEAFVSAGFRDLHATHPRMHADLDQRALAIARVVGTRVVRDPTLIERAQAYVREYLEEAPPGERKEMEEWAGILESMPPPRLRKFLVDPGQRATRLRQSLPFLGVLTPRERTALLKEAWG